MFYKILSCFQPYTVHILTTTLKDCLSSYQKQKNDKNLFFWPEYNRGNDPHRIKGHPCQLPIVLLEKLILTSSSSDDLIGDVFSGSGGTILAARLTGRDVVGFEIRKEYERIIYQKARFGQPVFPAEKQSTLETFFPK